MSDAALTCPCCKQNLTVEEVLEGGSVSWPNQSWFWLDCPRCDKGSHVEVGKGTLTTGEIDGGPGPCFMPLTTLKVTGLTVVVNANGITCTYHGKKHKYPAKQ